MDISTIDNRLRKEAIFLSKICMLGFILLFIRIIACSSIAYFFLIWNIILASVPWTVSSILLIHPKFFRKKILVFCLLAIWILFLPNSPYILTDLFHLSLNSSMPIWFDLVLILFFAWIGLMFGFLSLFHIERIALKHIPKKYFSLLITVIIFLTSFGVYLGRYLRWNSWDMLHKPHILILDIFQPIIHPNMNKTAWGMTLTLGVFLSVIYWSLKLFKSSNK